MDEIKKAASGEDAVASFLLWRLVDVDVISESGFDAAECLENAANGGLPNAQWRLAKQHLRNHKQSELGYQWLIRAASTDARAREDLAFWHLDERREARATKELAWVLTLAGARDGFSDLYNEIAISCEHGKRGRPNLAAAIAWCESGSQLGNRLSIYNRGIYARDAKDYELAIACFEKSAANGYENANLPLGEMFLQGLGVEQDLEKAQELLSGVDSRDARKLLAKIEENPNNGRLRLRQPKSVWTNPGYSRQFNQADHDRSMRRLRSSMQQNIGRRTGVFIGP